MQEASATPWWLAPAFFASGFAALIYQVVWQRVLFAGFGINIEAVTIVVAAFIAGLGIGSLIGGRLSLLRDPSPLRMFAAIEMMIGLYGFGSVRLFRGAAELSSQASSLSNAILVSCLLLIPTTLMGCTLPLLTAWLVERRRNVGSSVAQLYFVNTAGSALASLAAAAFMMGALGETRSVMVAASVNVLVSLFVWLQAKKFETAA